MRQFFIITQKARESTGFYIQIVFGQPKAIFLNDPKEFSYIETIIREVCCELIEEKSLCDMFLEDVLEENILCGGGRSKEYFVLSFSNCRDSITMWSEFGNETGYNIGFDSKRLIARIEENNTIEYHGLVLYEMEEQKKIVRRILNEGIPNEMQLSFSEIIEAGAKTEIVRNIKRHAENSRKSQRFMPCFSKTVPFGRSRNIGLSSKRRGRVFIERRTAFLFPMCKFN